MRIGIIGGGFGLRVQAPIIDSHPKMNVVAISTVHRHRLPETLQNERRIIHYTDWMNMLEREELDLLFVSSIPLYHYRMVKYAVQCGVHVVCEKPFTMNSEESKALLELSQKENVKVLIDFEWRYLPVRQKVKEWVDAKAIGDLLHIEYHVSSSQYETLQSQQSGWMGEKHHFGGMLGALGSHMIDCVRWLVGEELTEIQALLHTHVPIGAGEKRDADDAFFIHGRIKQNITFSLQLISGIHHHFDSHLRIFGTEGTISLQNDCKLYFGKAKEPLQEVNLHETTVPKFLSPEARAYYPAFYPFLNSVYNYIEMKAFDPHLPTVFDGHQNQIVLDRIREN